MSEGLFWWHFWIGAQVLCIGLIAVAIALFIKWSRRRAIQSGSARVEQ